MKTKIIFQTLVLFFAALAANAQSAREEIAKNPNKAGGVYYVSAIKQFSRTPTPKGYTPFYISHYGRHGSRFLHSENEYTETKQIFDAAANANALTEFGRDVYSRVNMVYENGINRAGDLAPLGVAQIRSLAEQLYRSYPEIFHGNSEVRATSSYVVRCILSMAAFTERLKEFNPHLQVSREAGRRTMRYINFFQKDVNPDLSAEYLGYLNNGTWSTILDSLKRQVNPTRLMKLLFKDESFLKTVDARILMERLFGFAVNMQNLSLNVSFYDLFTPDELYGLYLCNTYEYYVRRGPSPLNKRYTEYYAKPLLQDILDKADIALSKKSPSADLRFGHDTNLMPLLALMKIEGCYAQETSTEKIANSWRLYQLTPMAAHLEMIFYQNKLSKDVLIKFIYQGKEVRIPLSTSKFPYYRWNEVRNFYRKIMDELVQPSLSTNLLYQSAIN